MKTYEIKGHTVERVESPESVDYFTEYDLYIEGEYVGNLSKYSEETSWRAWNEAGELLGERKEIKSAVGLVVRDWEK